MNDKHTTTDPWRILISCVFLIGALGFFIVSFYRVGVLNHKKWQSYANNQHYITVNELGERGTIQTLNPISKTTIPTPSIVSHDIDSFTLYLDARAVPSHMKETFLTEFSEFIQNNTDYYTDDLKRHIYSNSRSRKLYQGLTAHDKDSISRWWKARRKTFNIRHNPFFFKDDFSRSHPFDELLGCYLHTCLGSRDENEHSVTTGGLESMFDSYLKGTAGKKRYLRTIKNRIEIPNDSVTSRPGSTINLTIDLMLQSALEEALKDGCIRASAKRTWGAMMNIHTGEIYAIGQYPYFHLQNAGDYFNDEKQDLTHLYSVEESFEPGSIFKPFVLAVCMQAASISPDPWDFIKPVDVNDFMLRGRSKPIKDVSSWKIMNAKTAIQRSSNVYFIKALNHVEETMGKQWIREKLLDLGFGQKTGFEHQNEQYGLVPRPDKKHANGTLEWSADTTGSLSMGHNISVTTVQILKALSTIANGGKQVHPHVVDSIISPHGEIQLDFQYDEKNVLNDQICNDIKEAMTYVTHVGGTGYRTHIGDIPIAAKSGTSYKIENGRYNPDKCVSSFMGFFPSNNPQFALCIHVDEPKRMKVDESSNLHHGGNCAAIIFKRIARQTMDIYNKDDQTVSENKQYVNDFKLKNQDLLNEMRSW